MRYKPEAYEYRGGGEFTPILFGAGQIPPDIREEMFTTQFNLIPDTSNFPQSFLFVHNPKPFFLDRLSFYQQKRNLHHHIVVSHPNIQLTQDELSIIKSILKCHKIIDIHGWSFNPHSPHHCYWLQFKL